MHEKYHMHLEQVMSEDIFIPIKAVWKHCACMKYRTPSDGISIGFTSTIFSTILVDAKEDLYHVKSFYQASVWNSLDYFHLCL